jgi:hypothetical protein
MQKGRDFENLVKKFINDANPDIVSKIEQALGMTAEGKRLSDYQYVTQLQINLGNGKYFIADNAWIKKVEVNGVVTHYECYVGETKLGTATDLSDNQGIFKTQYDNGQGTTSFTTRSANNSNIPQNSTLNVKKAVRVNGPGPDAAHITTSNFE